MARIVSEEELDLKDPGKVRRKRRLYFWPWDEWFDGQWRDVTLEFSISGIREDSFRSMVSQQAARRGLRASVRKKKDGGIYLKVFPQEDDGA